MRTNALNESEQGVIMTDLRKAAEMALEALEWNYGTDLENIENCMAWLEKMNATIPALRQALAQPEQEQKTPLKVLNLTVFTENRLRNGRVYDVETLQAMTNRDILAIPDMGKKALKEVLEALDVYAVNMSQERVDEMAKREHEPVGYIDGMYGGYMVFTPLNPSAVYLNGTALYTAPPISDYHEGWEEGFKAATREQEPFIYVREDNEKPFGGYEHCSEADAGAFPVYTAPQKRKWVGLTDSDKQEAFDETQEASGGFWEFADYLEAKLKEKNT